MECPGVRQRRHRLGQLRPVEHERRAVVDAVARRQRPVGHEPVEEGSPLRLAMVVRYERPAQHPEPVAHRLQLGPERVGREALEPADAARRDAAHHDTGLPCAQHCPIDAMEAPDREHVRGVAAGDEDEVLVGEKPVDVRHGPREEGQVARLGAAGERPVEVEQRRVAVRRGGRDVADPRPIAARPLAGEPEQERVEPPIVDGELERAPADRDDEPVVSHRAATVQSLTDGGRSLSNM
jgi:hypothetical protein